MKRPWMIRFLFVLLLTLCASTWVATYGGAINVGYAGTRSVVIWTDKGHIWLAHLMRPTYPNRGPFLEIWPSDQYLGFGFDRNLYSFLGFASGRQIDGYQSTIIISLPFWFLTLFFGLLLWWVWRKTAQLAMGRAFPVELKL